MTYRWSKGGVALDGENGSTLILPNIAPSDADDYQVAISNNAGRIESSPITVTVAQPATVISQPENVGAVVGETVLFSVVAAGTKPITYQWYKDGNRIRGPLKESCFSQVLPLLRTVVTILS